MQKRSAAMVIILTLITFGIYGLIWLVKTKNEMNRMGADIPTAFLIIIPIVNYWWMWKYAGGVEHVTKGKMSQVMAFILIFLLSFPPIAQAILQSEFNKVADGGQLPQAKVA